jgi:hypothetical protein
LRHVEISRHILAVLGAALVGVTLSSLAHAAVEPVAREATSVVSELPEPELALHTSVYTQSNFDRRTGDTVFQSRLEIPLWKHRSFQLHVGSEISQDSMSKPAEIYNDNFASVLAGASWSNAKYGLGTRLDALYSYRGTSATSVHDSPWGLGGKFVAFEYALREKVERHLFFETYSELSYQTWVQNDAFLQHWTKAGFRFPVARRLFLDLYPELVVRKDNAGLNYANFGEVRAGGRVLYNGGTFQSFVSATSQTPLFIGPSLMKSPLILELIFAAEL